MQTHRTFPSENEIQQSLGLLYGQSTVDVAVVTFGRLQVRGLMTRDVVGEILNVSEATVDRQVAAGHIPRLLVGSLPRFAFDDVHAYIERARVRGQV